MKCRRRCLRRAGVSACQCSGTPGTVKPFLRQHTSEDSFPHLVDSETLSDADLLARLVPTCDYGVSLNNGIPFSVRKGITFFGSTLSENVYVSNLTDGKSLGYGEN